MSKMNSDFVAAVYNALGVGKANARTRLELVIATHSSDRAVRSAIEILRRNKAIITLGDGKGYYIPEATEQGLRETERWIAMQDSRVKSIRMAQRGAKRFVGPKKSKGIPGQIHMFGGGA